MSKMGKTHFGGQLYGRLKSMAKAYKLLDTPDDLSLFEEILESLNDGVLGAHTSSNKHETITLPIQTPSDETIQIIYPDYGGEQVRDIVINREVKQHWTEQIQNSNSWFLFIRLDLMEIISDVTTKFYKQINEEKTNNNPLTAIKEIQENSSAFYIELLQIFRYVKKLSPESTKPNLSIVLSCWDKLPNKNNDTPRKKLIDTMPLLYNFIRSNWESNQLNIVGLSSLGKDLNTEEGDVDYQIEGPENFGYIIKPDGDKTDDITQILNYI